MPGLTARWCPHPGIYDVVSGCLFLMEEDAKIRGLAKKWRTWQGLSPRGNETQAGSQWWMNCDSIFWPISRTYCSWCVTVHVYVTMTTISSLEEKMIITSWHRRGAMENHGLSDCYSTSHPVSAGIGSSCHSQLARNTRERGLAQALSRQEAPGHFNDLMGAGKVTAERGVGGVVGGSCHIQVMSPDLSVQMSKVHIDKGQIPSTNPEWKILDTLWHKKLGTLKTFWIFGVKDGFCVPFVPVYLLIFAFMIYALTS